MNDAELEMWRESARPVRAGAVAFDVGTELEVHRRRSRPNAESIPGVASHDRRRRRATTRG